MAVCTWPAQRLFRRFSYNVCGAPWACGDTEMKEDQSLVLPPGRHYPHLTDGERRKPTKNPRLLTCRLFLPGRGWQGTNGEQQLWGLGPGFVPQLGHFLARRCSHVTNGLCGKRIKGTPHGAVAARGHVRAVPSFGLAPVSRTERAPACLQFSPTCAAPSVFSQLWRRWEVSQELGAQAIPPLLLRSDQADGHIPELSGPGLGMEELARQCGAVHPSLLPQIRGAHQQGRQAQW